ncbi:MAG: hypothetical protein JWM59_4662 [Verrucomicrobiales bacterium]|nr:hypothetical protein [Verrucomicrobiales bacterium]
MQCDAGAADAFRGNRRQTSSCLKKADKDNWHMPDKLPCLHPGSVDRIPKKYGENHRPANSPEEKEKEKTPAASTTHLSGEPPHQTTTASEKTMMTNHGVPPALISPWLKQAASGPANLLCAVPVDSRFNNQDGAFTVTAVCLAVTIPAFCLRSSVFKRTPLHYPDNTLNVFFSKLLCC